MGSANFCLGIPYSVSVLGAHWDSVWTNGGFTKYEKNINGEWVGWDQTIKEIKENLDSEDDQKAIWLGYQYGKKHFFGK